MKKIKALIEYQGKKFQLYYLTERNDEGTFYGASYNLITNTPVQDIHFTYPSNGKYHITITLQNKKQILLFPDKIIRKVNENDRNPKKIENKNELAKELVSLEKEGLMPFALLRSLPSPFKIINSLNGYELIDFVFFTPHTLNYANQIDIVTEGDFIVNIDNQKDKILALEVFISSFGVSKLPSMEILGEKILDNKRPVVKFRLVSFPSRSEENGIQ